MADDHDLVNRANTLMRPEGSPLGGRPEGEGVYGSSPLGGNRRRSFVAKAATAAESPATTPPPPAPDEDDDLPVLTEVIAPAAIVPEAPPSRFDETLLSIMASDLVHSIEQQLAIELPTLIEATLLNAQNELRSGIGSTLEMALRDFLTRRQQLSLPLDEPNRDD